MKHHKCTCIQCCNARTVRRPTPVTDAVVEAVALVGPLDLREGPSAEESAMLAWLPDRYNANAPFFGLNRSDPPVRLGSLRSSLPKERWWTRMRWKLGRWLSRGDPSA
jgi:hypothetical protein